MVSEEAERPIRQSALLGVLLNPTKLDLTDSLWSQKVIYGVSVVLSVTGRRDDQDDWDMAFSGDL